MKVMDPSSSNNSLQHLRHLKGNRVIFYSNLQEDECVGNGFETDYLIKFVSKGHELFQINGNKIRLGKNSLFLVRPGSEMKQLEVRGNGFMISFNTKLMNEVFDDLNRSEHEEYTANHHQGNDIFYLDSEIKGFGGYFNDLFSFLKGTTILEKDTFLFKSVARQLLLIQEEVNEKKNRLSFKSPRTKLTILNKLNIVKEYIETNSREKISLQILSEISCMSKYHLLRSFKEVFGITPYQYSLNVKLKEIHLKIVTSDSIDSLSDLAIEFGFSEYSLFYKHYKRLYKVKPSAHIF